MNSHTILKQIATVFSKNDQDFLELSKAVKEYRQLLVSIAELDLDESQNRKNIELNHGMALGTTWAAMCINDIVRTQKFIKGTMDAVNQLIAQKNPSNHKPIHVLYAGTGPFATLILPLMSMYTKKEIQFTLLEINQETISYLKKVLDHFNFMDYVHEIHCEDATKFQIPEELEIDLIVSETMQYALYRELQVPIMVNLLKQVKKETLIIPEEITVELGLWNASCSQELKFQTKKITEVLKLNVSEVNKWLNEAKGMPENIQFSKVLTQIIPSDLENFDKLVYFTRIKVFGSEIIDLNESGLTIPKTIPNLFNQITQKTDLEVQYQLHPIPQLVHTLHEG